MEWRKSSLALVALLFLVALSNVYAQGPIDEGEWDELRKELNYDEEQEEVSKNGNGGSPFLWGFFGTLFSSSIMLFGSILIIALVAFLIYLLIRHSRRANIKLPAKSASDVSLEEPDSSSSYQDLWDAFNRAKLQGNYKECIRLIHQICIKNLSESGLLKLHPDKTNWEYVSELKSFKLANDFSELTAEHELIWYGDSSIDETEFKKLELAFNDFLKSEELGQ